MKSILILSFFLLVACGETIKPDHYKQAEKACLKNEGVKYIYIAQDHLRANCNNGGSFQLKR